MSFVNGLENSVTNLNTSISQLNNTLTYSNEWNDNVGKNCMSYANSLVKVGQSFEQIVINLKKIESSLYQVNEKQDATNVDRLTSEVSRI